MHAFVRVGLFGTGMGLFLLGSAMLLVALPVSCRERRISIRWYNPPGFSHHTDDARCPAEPGHPGADRDPGPPGRAGLARFGVQAWPARRSSP